MSYSGFGDVSPTPDSTVAARTPPYSRMTASLMVVTAIPWAPVAAGYLLGKRFGEEDGAAPVWGAIGGFMLSFLVLRQILVKNAGTIT